MRRFPVYPLKPHAASGQARIKIAGRHHYLGKHGSQESHKRYAALVQQHADGLTPVTSGTATVAEIVARFLVDAAKEKPKKEMNHCRVMAGVVAKSIGGRSVTTIVAATLGEARRAMIDAGWSRNYIRAQINRAKAMFRWAESQGLAPRGTWETLRTLAPIPKTVRATKPREGIELPAIQSVLPYLPAVVQAMVQVQFWAGMRPSEVCRMRLGDLEQDGDGWLYWLSEHKNDWRPGRKREAVVLGAEAMKAALPWIEAARVRGEGAYIFPTTRPTRSQCYTVEGYGRALCRVFDAHPELERFTNYQSRHACRRRLLRECTVPEAAAQLRQSIVTLANYDRKQDLQLAKRAAKKTG